MFIGRGFLQYSFGLIPRRHPVTTVVGSPIDTEQTGTPSNEKVDEIHEQFSVALQKLFDEHKSKYIKNADKVRLMIEWTRWTVFKATKNEYKLRNIE